MEVETNKKTWQPELKNGSSSEKESENQRVQDKYSVKNENSQVQPNGRFPAPAAPWTTQQETINAKIAVETIRGINGQDDAGVEDFIKILKRVKTRCTRPGWT